LSFQYPVEPNPPRLRRPPSMPPVLKVLKGQEPPTCSAEGVGDEDDPGRGA